MQKNVLVKKEFVNQELNLKVRATENEHGRAGYAVRLSEQRMVCEFSDNILIPPEIFRYHMHLSLQYDNDLLEDVFGMGEKLSRTVFFYAGRQNLVKPDKLIFCDFVKKGDVRKKFFA